jgi:pyruvate kinase
VMDRIVRAAEVETGPGFVRRAPADQAYVTFEEAICLSASSAASATGAGAIVAFSERGMTARFVSKQRPMAPIIAFTPFESVRQQMALYWGVLPHTMAQIPTTDERINEAERRLKSEGLVKTGQRLVILSGTRIGHPGGTNLMKLHEVV